MNYSRIKFVEVRFNTGLCFQSSTVDGGEAVAGIRLVYGRTVRGASGTYNWHDSDSLQYDLQKSQTNGVTLSCKGLSWAEKCTYRLI